MINSSYLNPSLLIFLVFEGSVIAVVERSTGRQFAMKRIPYGIMDSQTKERLVDKFSHGKKQLIRSELLPEICVFLIANLLPELSKKLRYFVRESTRTSYPFINSGMSQEEFMVI